MKATVTVTPKRSVLDPQGVAVRNAVAHHGLPEVASIRIGKVLEIEVDDSNLSRAELEAKLHAVAADLLSNPVIEDYALALGE